MKMKDTPLAVKDFDNGMSLEEIAKKYGLNDERHAAFAIIMGQQYNDLKGVKHGDTEGTGGLQKEPG